MAWLPLPVLTSAPVGAGRRVLLATHFAASSNTPARSQRLSQLHTRAYQREPYDGRAGPDDAVGRSAPAGPGAQSRAMQAPAYPQNGRQQSGPGNRGQRPMPPAQRRSGPPAVYNDYPEQVTLRYVRDVQSKDVISIAQGTRLGRAGSIIVDTVAMTLEAIILKDTPRKGPSVYAECVPLDDLRQIGDVVLVSEESAVQAEPTVRGFLPVLGMNVKDAGGRYIGKVREVDFDPETGEINTLFYDEYGLSLPLSVFNLYGVSIEGVLKVGKDAVVIEQGYTWLEWEGKLEGVGKVFKTLSLVGGPSESPALVSARQRTKLQEWTELWGMTPTEWYEQYGDPRTRAPQQLPAPRDTDARRNAYEQQYAPPPRRQVQPQQPASRRPEAPQYADERARREPAPRPSVREPDGRPEQYRAPAPQQQRPGPASQEPQRPAFDQFIVRDDRKVDYEAVEDPPFRKQATNAINPRSAD